ncbi:MAG: GAF domain-containing protein [Desulfobacteraceae bacterium]|nr:GAF domain-containing protein [Desulfobacteraceae bacterium]
MEIGVNKSEFKENALDERLRFEILLSEMSATFINIPYDHIDSEIESGLRYIVEFMGFDRGSLFQLSEDGMKLTHSWAVGNFKAMISYIAEEEIPWAASVILKNKDILKFNSIDDLPAEAVKEREFFKKYGPVSVVAVPLLAGGEVIGTVAFGNLHPKQPLPGELVERIRLVGMIFANALMRKKAEESLQKAFFEINDFKDRLKLECGYLREEIELKFKHGEIIGQSDAIKKVLINPNVAKVEDAADLRRQG